MAKRKSRESADELVLKTQELIDLSVTYTSEELEAFRHKAVRYFKGDTPDGLRDRPNRSSYVDTVLRDTILWVMPSLSRVFSSTFDVVELRPRGAYSADQVAVSQSWVNQVLTAMNSNFVLDTQAMQDALQFRLGFQRVKWTPDNQIRIEALEPQNVLISRHATVDRLAWPFIGIKTETSPGQLRAEGFQVDDDIDGPELEGYLDIPLDEMETQEDDDMSLVDKAFKRVYKYEMWWPDYDQGAWNYAVRVGMEVLEYKLVAEHEVLFWTPIIQSHRLDGLSLSDLSFKLQDISTALHRSVNDHLYRTSNPREEIVLGGMSEWTYGDLINDQLDGRIRVRQVGTINPLPSPPLPQSVMQTLEHYDERISARTGVQKYQQGLAPDALNKTASGTAMIMDAASLRIEQIARTFAETGFKDRVGLILRMSRREPERLAGHTVELYGQSVPLSAEMLVEDFDVLVNVGVGVGNRTERAAALTGHMNFFMTLLGNPAAGRLLPGGDLAVFSAANLFETQAELLKLSGYTNTHSFLIDPRNPALPRDQPLPPPPPTPEEQYVEVEREKVALAKEKTMYEQLQAIGEMKLKVREKEANASAKLAELRLADMQAELERERTLLEDRKAELEMNLREREFMLKEKELEMKATDMILKYQEAGILPVEQMATLLTQMQNLQQIADAMQERAKAPTQITYDENGNIVGAERRVGKVISRKLVKRDETGKPTGVEEEESEAED